MSTGEWIAIVTAAMTFIGMLVSFVKISIKLGAILENVKQTREWQIEHEKKDEKEFSDIHSKYSDHSADNKKEFGVLYDRTNNLGERISHIEGGDGGARSHYGHG